MCGVFPKRKRFSRLRDEIQNVGTKSDVITLRDSQERPSCWVGTKRPWQSGWEYRPPFLLTTNISARLHYDASSGKMSTSINNSNVGVVKDSPRMWCQRDKKRQILLSAGDRSLQLSRKSPPTQEFAVSIVQLSSTISFEQPKESIAATTLALRLLPWSELPRFTAPQVN